MSCAVMKRPAFSSHRAPGRRYYPYVHVMHCMVCFCDSVLLYVQSGIPLHSTLYHSTIYQLHRCSRGPDLITFVRWVISPTTRSSGLPVCSAASRPASHCPISRLPSAEILLAGDCRLQDPPESFAQALPLQASSFGHSGCVLQPATVTHFGRCVYCF